MEQTQTNNEVIVYQPTRECYSQHGKLASQKFAQVATSDIGEVFGGAGYKLVSCREGGLRVRRDERQGYQRHIATWQSETSVGTLKSRDIFPTIRVVNNSEGKGSLLLSLGLFRLVCKNGLVAGTAFDMFRVSHLGDIQNKLADMLPRLLFASSHLQDTILKFENTVLTSGQIKEIAHRAMKLRVNGVRDVTNSLINIKPQAVDTITRIEDNSDDLFTVFNRIQENIVKHGVQYSIRDEYTNTFSNHTARSIKANTEIDLNFNRQLFDIVSEYAA